MSGASRQICYFMSMFRLIIASSTVGCLMRYFNLLWVGLCLLLMSCGGSSGGGNGSSSQGDVLAGLDHRPGFVDLYIDEKNNKVLARLPQKAAENSDDNEVLRFIYTMRLTAGLGSNPVGLDRGWGDAGQIVVFRRFGNKMIVEAENTTYRASADNALEKRAVRESFARSFLASVKILRDNQDGLVVDLTNFLTRDGLNLVQYLRDRGEGSFSRVADRTFVDTKNTFAFPDNVEVDVFLTLASADPGREVATTAANGRDVTLIQHHSFVRLPEDGFVSRPADPRSGAIEVVHYDYSASLTEPIETRIARRYRLQKDQDGNVIKPIVFYIDGGVPEPVLSALLEGARWWEDAFSAAGFPGGYKVEILPEDAHPLDVRYNVVQWVHRQTRGWSYGGGVSDPRSGEMLKGHVNLGSLRVRQDRMIFEGLSGTQKTGSGAADDPVELALARIRQLSAHEIGHALGLAHNFAASSYDFGSVMDYPAPNVGVRNGALDFSNTYGVGIGEWDKFSTTWLYGDLDADERDALIDEAYGRGLSYVADRDARSIGTAHPKGAVWDNGVDPVETLREVMEVRRIALENFGPDRLRDGEPRSQLGNVIVPIYLYHRYQMAAAGKKIGGMDFNYGRIGDGQASATIVPRAEQEAALDALLDTLRPDVLDMPDHILRELTPPLGAFSFIDSDRERFRPTAYPAFDTSAAADTAADLTLSILLDPRRAARLVEFKRRDPSQLGWRELLDWTRDYVAGLPQSGSEARLAQTVQTRFAFRLMDMLDEGSPTAVVKSEARSALVDFIGDLAARAGRNDAHAAWLSSRITQFLSREVADKAPIVNAPQLPPGSPIGSDPLYETCWHCEPL